MRNLIIAVVVVAIAAVAAYFVFVQPQESASRNALTIGQTLEPPHLDPTAGAAQAIDGVTYQNIFQGLTQITGDGSVAPSLAESWEISDDGLTYTFKLKEGVTFHDGAEFDSGDVKFSLERATAEGSENAQKGLFEAIESVEAPDAATVVITLKRPTGAFLYNMGWGDAVIVDPASADTNKTAPVGTGPYKLTDRKEGDSITLTAVSEDTPIQTVTFRFIAEPSAQVNALLAGDIDFFPGFQAAELLERFDGDENFTVSIGSTEGETVLSTNNTDEVLSDIRVRQAIAHTIDRQQLIDGIYSGYGTPIGSHFAPHHPDYIDLVDTYPHDLDKARALLAEAGYGDGLKLVAKLPPPAYARRGGEILAAQFKEVGIELELVPLEWAQWLEEVFKATDYQLTIVSHTEPNDIEIYARDTYYFNYDSPEMKATMEEYKTTADEATRSELIKEAQRIIAEDAVNGYLFQLPLMTIADAGLQGYWTNAPTAANVISEMSWSE